MSVGPQDIVTARLRLCAMTDEPRNADKAGDPLALGKALRCNIAEQWPPEHWEPHVFEFLEQQFAAHPEHIAWNRYIVLRGTEDVLVGNCNAFQVDASTAEVGYSIVPAHQGQGIATEAVTALLAFLRSHTELTTVRAHTFPYLAPSLRVMEKCGFVPDGAGEEGTVRYTLSLA